MTLLSSDSPFSDEPLAPGIRARPGSLILRYSRSSGPGGQNVNKVNTKADLRIAVDDLIGLTHYARNRLENLAGRRLTIAGELHFVSDAHRTQEGNKAEVFRQLRELLVEAMHRPKIRRKTKPSKGSKQRRLDTKKHTGEIKRLRRGSED